MSCSWSMGRLGHGLPKESNVGGWRRSVGNDALHVIGLYGLGDKISLYLKGIELSHCAEHAVPGNA